MLLRLHGAKIGKRTKIYPSVKFFTPQNATIGDDCILGPDVDFYNVSPIHVGDRTIVSQYAHLCAATHDFRSTNFTLIPMPITLGTDCWVAAGAFIGPGVTINDEAVVGARAVVCKNVASNTVVAGNPAKLITHRNQQECLEPGNIAAKQSE